MREVKINTEILIETINKQRHSLTANQLKEYREFRKKFEGDEKDSNKRNSIDFRK